MREMSLVNTQSGTCFPMGNTMRKNIPSPARSRMKHTNTHTHCIMLSPQGRDVRQSTVTVPCHGHVLVCSHSPPPVNKGTVASISTYSKCFTTSRA